MEERLTVAQSRNTLRQSLSPALWVRTVAADVRDLYRTRFILRNLVVTQLKIRYHRSALGFVWTLLNPILMLGVQAVIFQQIITMDRYALYLFSGFIPWQFFAATIEVGSNSMVNKEDMIRRIAVSKLVFPLAEVLVCLINMLFAMLGLLAIFQFLGATFHVQFVILPLATILWAVFAFGLVLIGMSLITFFRDFQHLIPILLSALYFLSPIMWPPELIKKYELVVLFNPIAHFLSLYQQAIYYGTWPTFQTWAIVTASAFASLLTGYLVYKKLEHEYIFRL